MERTSSPTLSFVDLNRIGILDEQTNLYSSLLLLICVVGEITEAEAIVAVFVRFGVRIYGRVSKNNDGFVIRIEALLRIETYQFRICEER
jgi:hypothetical protein